MGSSRFLHPTMDFRVRKWWFSWLRVPCGEAVCLACFPVGEATTRGIHLAASSIRRGQDMPKTLPDAAAAKMRHLEVHMDFNMTEIRSRKSTGGQLDWTSEPILAINNHYQTLSTNINDGWAHLHQRAMSNGTKFCLNHRVLELSQYKASLNHEKFFAIGGFEPRWHQ